MVEERGIYMKTLLYILGTRPEAVKMCPLIRTIKNRNICHNTVFLTGQHGRAASEVLDFFEVAADITSEAVHAPSLYMLTDELFRRAEKTLAETNPDYVAVHGDTASAFTGAMAAFYRKIPILHIEAGLRTYRKYMPYPEEFFRRAIAAMAEYHFAPTEEARRHLLSEGVADDRIFVTGNTIRDAIDYGAGKSHIHCPEKTVCIADGTSARKPRRTDGTHLLGNCRDCRRYAGIADSISRPSESCGRAGGGRGVYAYSLGDSSFSVAVLRFSCTSERSPLRIYG